ncbi:MAG: sulfotransferase [Methylococcaceae bacterium]
MNFSSILIVTYGRSGSTLLQGLLNSIDNCLIRGENYNFCYSLFEAYEALAKAKQEDYKKGRPSLKIESPWYGAASLDEDRFIEDARKLVFNQLNPDGLRLSCLGFKEIRYIEKKLESGKLHDYLNFLEKLFPNPAFIVLTRDHDQVMQSGWWKSRDSKQTKDQLETFEKNIFAYCANKTNTFSITYSDMVERSQNLAAMFQFLGVPYHSANVEKVLHTKHSYQPKPVKATQDHAFHVEQTQHPFIQYAKIDELTAKNLQSLSATGVIVLSSDFNKNYTLIAVSAGHEYKVNWNIASPRMAEKFSGNIYAEKARFRVDNLTLTKNQELDIYLKDDVGNKHLVFKIFLNS